MILPLIELLTGLAIGLAVGFGVFVILDAIIFGKPTKQSSNTNILNGDYE